MRTKKRIRSGHMTRLLLSSLVALGSMLSLSARLPNYVASAAVESGTWKDVTYDLPYQANGIAVDSHGDLFVTANGNQVEELPSGATNWKNLNDGHSFVSVAGIAVDAAGDLFVVDPGSPGVNYLQKLPAGTSTWQSLTYGYTFNQPDGIAVDSTTGNVYVSSSANIVYKLPGSSTSWQNITNSFAFATPIGIAVDSNDNVYVVDYTGNGNPNTVDELPSGSSTWLNITHGGAFKLGNGIAVDGAGDVFVTNYYNNTSNAVMELPYGTTTWQNIPLNGFTGKLAGTAGIAVDSSGDLFVANSTAGATNRVDEYIPLPPAPANVSSSSTTYDSTTLSWDAVSGATSYNVYEDGGSTPIATGVTGISYAVTGLTLGTSYTFTVSAVSSNGESAPSTSVSVTTISSAPTGLASSGTTQTGTNLTWTAPTGATSYNIYENGNSTALATGVTTTSYTVTGLTANTAYTFTVSALNASGESAQSSSTSMTTLPNAPGAPTGVSHANVTTSGWTESWSAVVGASSYNVYVNGTKVNSSPITGTSFTVTWQPSRTTFTVAVTAINAGGESPQATDTVTTLAPPPPPPLPSAGDSNGSGSDIQVSVNGSTQSVSTDGGQASKDTGTTTVDVTVPKGAMPGGDGIIINIVDPKTILPTVPVQQPTEVPTTKPTMVVGVKVSFTGAPPVVPITVTIHNANVQAGGVLYKVLPDDTIVPMNATVTDGQIVVTFSTDPNFVLVNPPRAIGLASYERVIVLDGQVFVVPSRVSNNTTYIPIWYVMQVMKKLDMSSIWTGTDWYLATNSPTNMSNVSPGNGTMHMYLNGTLVQANDKQAWNDPFSGKKTTYVPIWYLMQLLKRVHVTNMWDGKEWVLIPNS